VPLVSAAEISPAPPDAAPAAFPPAEAPEFEFLSFFFLLSCSCDAFAFALALASTLAEAPEVCALWLALAPAPACPGVTEALPDAEPLAEVCATAPAIKMPAVIAAIQYFLIVIACPFSLLDIFSTTGGFEVAVFWIQMQFVKKTSTLNLSLFD
jgi:hypothetical protein